MTTSAPPSSKRASIETTQLGSCVRSASSVTITSSGPDASAAARRPRRIVRPRPALGSLRNTVTGYSAALAFAISPVASALPSSTMRIS